MPSFEYIAAAADGRTVQDVAFGTSADEVRARLAENGLRVLQIQDAYAGDPLRSGMVPTPPIAETPAGTHHEEVSASEETQRWSERPRHDPTDRRSLIATNLVGPLVGRVPLRELSLFFRQFGTMVEAGVPMVQGLDTLAGQSQSGKMRGILREMGTAVEEGRMLSSVMQRYPEVFSPLMMALVRAGEQGGFLGQALKETATYTDHEIDLRNMYRRETFWPKLQVAASILIIIGANMIIKSINQSRGTDAPGLESPLTDPATYIWLAPVLIGLFLFFRVGLAQYWIKQGWDHITLLVPFVGKTVHHFAMAKFGRAFGALYKGGVPVTQALLLAADACGNEHLRARIYPAAKELEGGAGIGSTLRSTGAFSPVVLNMVDTGEMTGSLDQMLTKMAEFYEDEGKLRARQMVNVVSVVCILAVAIYIAYIVITFWMKMYAGIGAEIEALD